jgi:hypothetical protein
VFAMIFGEQVLRYKYSKNEAPRNKAINII